MMYSMTGYGRSEFSSEKTNISVEIKSVNSKNCDINIRLPYVYNEKEIEIRNLIHNSLKRGKISVYIDIERLDSNSAHEIDIELAKSYFKQLKQINSEIEVKNYDYYLNDLLKLPEVVKAPKEEVDEEEYRKLKACLNEALEKINISRKEEAKALESDFIKHIKMIESLLAKVDTFEKERIVAIENRMKNSLKNISDNIEYDKNRFEQELIYYLEKLDITEEKVRLAKHCEYFLDTLNDKGKSKGKKLNFISQEIGREINTLGSKSNSSDLQRIVVQMKDELEKIKEQLLNIL